MAKASTRGQDGEIRVALDIATLDRSIYHAVHNVTVMAEDGTTQIDHVVISKYGIFVVETKNYFGWIFGSEKQPEWTRVSNGSKNTFQNPIRQNFRHTKSLSTLLGVDDYLMHSVVAFCGESEFKTAMPPYVLDTDYANYIRSKKITLFSDAEVLALVDKLKASMLERGEETDQKHLDSLRERHASKAAVLTLEKTGGGSGTRRPRGRRNPADKENGSTAWRSQAGNQRRFDRAGGKQRKTSNTPARIVVALLFAGVMLLMAIIFIQGMNGFIGSIAVVH